jgi:hypothetical protein
MVSRYPRLRANAQRGSKPRCHLLTDGASRDVAARLTALVAPHAVVGEQDSWMPQGFSHVAEPELDKAERLLDDATRSAMARWWLPEAACDARTPNFDIASTCKVDGRKGLLLVEAKAHCDELKREAAGRKLTVAKEGERAGVGERRRLSHGRIGLAIDEACAGLIRDTGLPWAISRETAYQMANRFAWAWKLTELGFPVVLVYLGFLNAADMADQSAPFRTGEDWEREVLQHSPAVPAEAWGRRRHLNGMPFVALIKSLDVPLA